MSLTDNKANYHPISQLAGNLPNGSYTLPGNGYYSLSGVVPRLQFDHGSKFDDHKYKYSQGYRIDPLHSLLSLKEESTLTRYHHHNPPVEQCRDRYVHVPKFVPREDTLIPHEGLEHLKKLAGNRNEYSLNKLTKLPGIDYNVLPEKNFEDEAYRAYQAEKPYDMMVLRDMGKYDPANHDIFNNNPTFISASTIPR